MTHRASNRIPATAAWLAPLLVSALMLAGCASKERDFEAAPAPEATVEPEAPAEPAFTESPEIDSAPLSGTAAANYGQAAPLTRRIALVLPLTGQYGGVGSDLLDAATLAVFDIGGERMELVVADTQGTPEGALYLESARRILAEIDGMEAMLGVSRATPKGLLRVNATLGFGRSHVAPLISRFARKYPQVEVQLQLSVNPPPLTEDSFDVCIRFGAPPDSRVIARYIAPNRRLLCASPAYLAKRGVPKVPGDLGKHNCIGIRQGEEAYGVWRLSEAEDCSVSANLARIDSCLAQGITTFDHADIYGDYRCEALFGEAIKSRPSLKSQIEIVTKTDIMLVSPSWPDTRVKHYDTSAAHVNASVERSLSRIGVDRIDLLLIHRPDPLMDPDALGTCLDALVDCGKVRGVGVSNFLPGDVDLLQSRMKHRLQTNQIELGLLNTAPFINGQLAHAQQHGMSID